MRALWEPQPPPERRSVFDLEPGHPDDDWSPAVVRCLKSKGFAVVPADTPSTFSAQVFQNIKALNNQGLLVRPPRLLADGYLGENGSAKVFELDSPYDEPDVDRGEGIRLAEEIMNEMGDCMVEDIQRELGIAIVGRTPSVIHEPGEPEGDEPPMTGELAQIHLTNWARAKLMMLHFLGPGEGKLKLTVIGEEESDPFIVPTAPGMIVILRNDMLMHEHCEAQAAYVLSCFYAELPDHWYSKDIQKTLVPAARALDEWLIGSLKEIRQQVDPEAESSLEPSIPRSLQKVMNRMFLKGDRTAIRGHCGKFANTKNVDDWNSVLLSGTDFATEVPKTRWDHTGVYATDFDAYRYGKVYCMHNTWVPDIDLFDNKFFLISPSEASKMDPAERMMLECGYECFQNAGLRKKDIMNSDCGVYCAWHTEQHIGTEDRGMGANRCNFVYGCKGPSVCFDTDHASSLLAIKYTSDELGRACMQGLTIACRLQLNPHFWVMSCANHMLSPSGRCSPFDANASGYIHADTVAALYMKKLFVNIDGEEIWDEKGKVDAVMQAATCRNQGRAASFMAMNGPMLQEALADGIRTAKISPLDMEVIECDAKADIMHDAVEVGAIMRVCRPQSEQYTGGMGADEPLCVGSAKSNIGSALPAAGMSQILKIIASGLYGHIHPTLHLKQINPLIYSEAFEGPLLVPTEALDSMSEAGYQAVMAFGWGGTMANNIFWNRVDTERVGIGSSEVTPVSYWPGGGGYLNADEKPASEYSIVGTWSGWTEPSKMELESDGVYGYTVTLGENCWELFQIWFDGDETKVLHPGHPKAGKSSGAIGPEDCGVFNNWLIDGRADYVEAQEGDDQLALTGGVTSSDQRLGISSAGETDEGLTTFYERSNLDKGWPGAEYRVRLRIKGKWRCVDWERITPLSAEQAWADSVEVKGQYYISGTFNDWGFTAMSPDIRQDVYAVEVTLKDSPFTDFQILRNRDQMQVIYPSYARADGRFTEQVLGPDENPEGLSWLLQGRVGDTFRVEFERSFEDAGWSSMSVSWRKVS